MSAKNNMNMTIADKQAEIVSEFELLAGDRESTIFYIMELGQKLEALPETAKTEDNIIKGCQSKVWMTSQYDQGKVRYLADSNTDLTKGLIALLVRVLDDEKPQDIVDAELGFLQQIGMGNFIGSQRSNGLAAMIKQMKLHALAYSAKS